MVVLIKFVLKLIVLAEQLVDLLIEFNDLEILLFKIIDETNLLDTAVFLKGSALDPVFALVGQLANLVELLLALVGESLAGGAIFDSRIAPLRVQLLLLLIVPFYE